MLWAQGSSVRLRVARRRGAALPFLEAWGLPLQKEASSARNTL